MIKKGDFIELSGSNSIHKVLETWKGFEDGRKDRPVIWGIIQRVKKDFTLMKSDKPKNEILVFLYGGKPAINGEKILKK
jgi:hypothetical protein